MLGLRLLTGLVLAPLFVAAVVYLPTTQFTILTGAIVALGAWEWASLAGLSGRGARGLYVVALLALGLVVHALDLGPVAIVVGLAWWFVVALTTGDVEGAQGAGNRWLLRGGLALVPAWLALTAVHAGDSGPLWVLFAMGVVWSADIGAYAAGRSLGRRKLAPTISPGKTFEGLAGGLVAAALAVLVFSALRGLAPAPAAYCVALGVAGAMFSVVGDLTESRLKRRVGAKDSGRWVMGHGGVLDRIDSTLAAAPVFAAALALYRPT